MSRSEGPHRRKMLLPNHALVVRGGSSSAKQIDRSVFVSRECINTACLAVICGTLPMKDLCVFIPHKTVRSTTVEEIRKSGGDVILFDGPSPHHAIVTGIYQVLEEQKNVIYNWDMRSASANVDNIPTDMLPRIFADFLNADRLGRIRLNTVGAKKDMASFDFRLEDGMTVELYDDDIVISGVARYDCNEGWVVEVDWRALESG